MHGHNDTVIDLRTSDALSILDSCTCISSRTGVYPIPLIQYLQKGQSHAMVKMV